MPKDGEASEDNNSASIGSFEDLRAYFAQKFSHLKRELLNDQAKFSSSLVKNRRKGVTLLFSGIDS